MFTGIIEKVGQIKKIEKKEKHLHLTIESNSYFTDIKKGDSVSIDGVCLTILNNTDDQAIFDVAVETQQKTCLKNKQEGSPVNLEKAMSAAGRFDGHIVQGHTDGTGTVKSLGENAGDIILTIETTKEISEYLVQKGSVAINGTSLTIVSIQDQTFTIMILDHTAKNTNLGDLESGDIVNIETDILAKYIKKFVTTS